VTLTPIGTVAFLRCALMTRLRSRKERGRFPVREVKQLMRCPRS
jgi:hypothetical protein